MPLDWLVRRPIAHRGLHDSKAGVVENSASAFAAAIRHGYAIECDLQLTADGEAVVFHDTTLDRLMTAKGALGDWRAAELKRISFKSGGDRIQTLQELLDQAASQVPLVIEIKSRWNGDDTLVRRAVEVLRPYGGRYSLMSFDPDIVGTIGRLAPSVPRGLVADRGDDDSYASLPFARQIELRSFSHLPRIRPDFISFYFRDLPFAPVEAIRSMGKPVITWTIRSAEEARWALHHSDQITFEGFLA